MFKSFLYLCGIFILAGMISSIFSQLAMHDAISKTNTGIAARLEALVSLNYLAAAIFILLAYTAITLTILSYIALYIEKGKLAPEVEEVWAYFKYYFFRTLLASVLVSVFTILGFVFCVIPGIYVFPAMTLFFPALIFENGSIGYCFSRSFKLLKGQWWTTAAVLIVIWIITYACTLFVSIPGIILTLVSTLTSDSKLPSTLSVVVTSILQYLSQIFLIIPLITSAFCYFNLREIQESSGLLERLNQFGMPNQDLDSTKEAY